MPPRKLPVPVPPTAAPQERRRSTDKTATEIKRLDSHITQRDETWKTALQNLEDRLFEEFKAFKQFIQEALTTFADNNALTEEEKTYLRTHAPVWRAQTTEEVAEWRAAQERAIKFVDGEEQHRADVLALAKAESAKLAEALMRDRRLARRRWKVASQLAAILVPAVLSLLGGVFISQFQRLSTIDPRVVIAFGVLVVLSIIIVFITATYVLNGDDTQESSGGTP